MRHRSHRRAHPVKVATAATVRLPVAGDAQRRRTARGLGSLEQFEHMAAPMPNQLVPITSEQHDDRHSIDRPAATVTDGSLSVHASIIGTAAAGLQGRTSDHRYSPPCFSTQISVTCVDSRCTRTNPSEPRQLNLRGLRRYLRKVPGRPEVSEDPRAASALTGQHRVQRPQPHGCLRFAAGHRAFDRAAADTTSDRGQGDMLPCVGGDADLAQPGADARDHDPG